MDFVPIHMLISNQLMDNIKLDWILKQLRLNGAIALSFPPFCYWWLIMKKRGLTLYRITNPNPRAIESAIAPIK